MKEEISDKLITVIVAVIVIGFLALLIWGIVKNHQITEVAEGEVVDVQYISGGWGSSSKTIIKLKNGRVVVFFTIIPSISIGKSIYLEKKRSGKWRIVRQTN